MFKSARLVDVEKLVRALEKYPFGSLVLLLMILSIALVVWTATR